MIHYFATDAQGWFREFIGAPDAIINSSNIQIKGVNDTFWTLCSQDGVTFWVGGRHDVSEAASSTLWKSVDCGLNWTNECTLLPGSFNCYLWTAYAFPNLTNEIWLAGSANKGSDNWRVWKYNGVSFDVHLDLATIPAGRGNNFWGTSPTDLYLATCDGNCYLYYNGVVWQKEVVRPGNVNYIDVAGVDTNTVYVLLYSFTSGNYEVWRGKFGGPWVMDPPLPFRPNPIIPVGLSNGPGRVMMADETGAIWLACNLSTGGIQILRRDPTSGVWSESHYLAGQTIPNIYVVSSTSIAVVGQCSLCMYDGSTWYDYLPWPLWGWTNSLRGVWGYDDSPPVPPPPPPTPLRSTFIRQLMLTNDDRIALDFPLQFQGNGDVVLSSNEKTINDTINLSVFVKPYGVPLFPLGVGVETYAFDPNDEVLQAELEIHITDGLTESVDGIQVNHSFTFRENENTLSVAVPYVNTRTKKNSSSLISIPRQKVE